MKRSPPAGSKDKDQHGGKGVCQVYRNQPVASSGDKMPDQSFQEGQKSNLVIPEISVAPRSLTFFRRRYRRIEWPLEMLLLSAAAFSILINLGIVGSLIYESLFFSNMSRLRSFLPTLSGHPSLPNRITGFCLYYAAPWLPV